MWPYNGNPLPPGERGSAQYRHEHNLEERTPSPFMNMMPFMNLNQATASSNTASISNSSYDDRERHANDALNFYPHQSSQQSENQPPSATMSGEAKKETSAKTTLDPRLAAAELKEKLLRSKGQRHGRESQLGPLDEVSHNTVRPEKRSFSENSTRTTTSRFIPHPLPQMPARNSVPADAEDIEALISSISSATQRSDMGPAGKASNPDGLDRPVLNASAGAGVSPSQSWHNQNIPGLGNHPQNPAKPPAQAISSSAMVSQAEPDNVAAGHNPSEGTRPAQTSMNTRVLPGLAEELNTNDNGMPAPSKNKFQGNSTGASGKASTLTSASHLEKKQQPEGVNNSESNSIASLDVYSPSYNPTLTNEAKGGKNAAATGPFTIPANPSNNMAKHVPPPLIKLLEEDRDLQDWLTYTQYFNVETRTKKLTRYRRLAEMEAEEQRIKAEQERLAEQRRKLLEEDDSDQYMIQYKARMDQTSQPLAPATSNFDAAHTKQNPAGTSNLQVKHDYVETEKPIPAENPAALKRSMDDDIDQAHGRAEKMPRLEAAAPKDAITPRVDDSAPRTASDTRARPVELEQQDGVYHRRSRSDRRSASPRRHSRSPYGKPQSKYDDGGYERVNLRLGQYDSYRGNGNRDDWYRSPSPRDRPYRRQSHTDPKPIDLGGRGETRFFIVKSFNEDNVRQCMEDGLWTTQIQNTEVFTSAFAKCKNVILFFSINKSRAFQGYARMATAPSPDTPRPRWIKGIHWETSPPFRVEWLSTTETEFYHFGQLTNSLNNDLPVLVGKDGQEIEEECGRKLLDLMGRVIHSKHGHGSHNPRDTRRSESPHRGRGGYQIRGRGGGKYIKREDR